MDNRGTPAPSNFSIRWYVAYQKIQDPSKCWPFGEICEYSRNIDLSCRVPLSNRRGRQIVEAPESSARRRNTEADNVVDENHRAITIVISSGSETDSGDDTANEAEQRRIGKAVAHEIPSADEAERRRKGKAAAHEISSDIEIDIPSGGETDSEDDAGAEIEYERQLNVAILESLKSFYNFGSGLAREFKILKEGGTRSESEAAEGNVGNIDNDSALNPVVELANVSHCPNEESVDEGAQTEALDAVRGYELVVYNGNGTRSECEADIGNTEHIDSMPRPRVSSRGRLLKPTLKLLQLPITTAAPGGEGTSGSERKQPKRRRLNPIIARERSMPRIPVGAADGSNNASNNVLGMGGEVGVSEPSGSGSVVGLAGRANGVARQADVVNPDGSGVGVEVGGSGPSEPTSVAGQASGVDDVGRETDMVVPFLEPMVCVTNQNPMDLSIEEAKKYMRTE